MDRRCDFLYAACRRITADNAYAEDALQEALINLYLKAGSFRGESEPRTWLFRIAVNAANQVMRGAARTPVADGEPRWDRQAPGSVADEATTRVTVDWALQQLPQEQWTAIVYRAYGFSYKEIADATGCNIDTVSSRIHAAKGKLRKLLDELDWRTE